MIGLFRRHPELDAMSACRQVTHLDIQARKLFQFLDELFVLFDYNSSAFHWDELIEYKSREKFLKDAMAYIKSTKLPPKKSII
jgi:acyl-homoserine lactone acylase PvdQ